MEFGEGPLMLGIITDDPAVLRPANARRRGRWRWPIRAAFLVAHLAILGGIVAWAEGKLPWPGPDRVEAASASAPTADPERRPAKPPKPAPSQGPTLRADVAE